MAYDDEEADWTDDYGDSTESATVVCAECGSEIYQDAIRCPVCDSYVDSGERSRIKMHWRVVALILLTLGVWWVITRINLLLNS